MSMPLMLYLRHDVPRATGTPCGGSQQDKPPPLGFTGSSEFFTVLVLGPSKDRGHAARFVGEIISNASFVS